MSRITINIVTCLTLVIALSSTGMAGSMKSLEDARETSSSELSLPASDTATLYFINCSSCNVNPLQLSKDTKLFLGEQLVSYSQFKKAAEASSRMFTVFYDPVSYLVTRIKM